MANWINIICVLMLCGYNQTYSQMISGCDEFDACTTDLVAHLSSENLVLCRKLLEYIPCAQGAQERCPSLNPKKVEEMTTFASETYNDRNCSAVLEEISTSTESTKAVLEEISTSTESIKGVVMETSSDQNRQSSTHYTTGTKSIATHSFTLTKLTSESPIGDAVSEQSSFPREVSSAAMPSTFGRSIFTDRMTKLGINPSTFSYKTAADRSESTPGRESETDDTDLKFTKPALTTKVVPTHYTTGTKSIATHSFTITKLTSEPPIGDAVSEQSSFPREVSSAAMPSTFGRSIFTDRMTKLGINPSSFSYKTAADRSESTPGREPETDDSDLKFTTPALTTKDVPTNDIDQDDGDSVSFSIAPEVRFSETPESTADGIESNTAAVHSKIISSTVPTKNSHRVTSTSFVPELSTQGTSRLAFPSTRYRKLPSATTKTSTKTDILSQHTTMVSPVTSLRTGAATPTKTWSNSRSSSVLERTTSSSLGQSSKTPSSSVDYVNMEYDTSGVTTRRGVCLPTLVVFVFTFFTILV